LTEEIGCITSDLFFFVHFFCFTESSHFEQKSNTNYEYYHS
jgi:hypothetical protein